MPILSQRSNVRSTAFRRETAQKPHGWILSKAPQSPKRHKTASAGFTLIELIIVLTLLAVLSSAVIPVFSGSLGRVESDHTVRDLVALIKYGQERAVTDLKEYRLYLDPEQGHYFLMMLKRTPEGEKDFVPLDEHQGEALVLPPRIEMAKPKARKDRERDLYYIPFYPSGACDKARIPLEIKQEGRDRKVTIETQGSLGRIVIKR